MKTCIWKSGRIYFLLIFPIFFFQCKTFAQSSTKAVSDKSKWPIITRKGDKLYEGNKTFRFFGLAAPNIQQNESQIREDRTNRFPDEFEIRDALGAMQTNWGKGNPYIFFISIYPG